MPKTIPPEIGFSASKRKTLVHDAVNSSAFLRSVYIAARQTVDSLLLLRQVLYDYGRLWRFSSAVRFGDNKAKLKALLDMAFHSFEKGMSLQTPRPGFGQTNANTLITRLRRYIDYCGADEHCVVALNVLRAYEAFNLEHGVVLPGVRRAIEEFAPRVKSSDSQPSEGGVHIVKRREFLEASNVDLAPFYEARHSVRQFSEEKVDGDLIKCAVHLAQNAPSVCNRQSAKVWVIQSPHGVLDALRIQGGARGFEQSVSTILVISSDLSCFQSSGERNQCWIDGGLFAMSLVYALHSLQLVSCCLNWSKRKNVDMAFRKRFSIPACESIVMLVAVGHPREQYQVADSWRRPLNEVLFHLH